MFKHIRELSESTRELARAVRDWATAVSQVLELWDSYGTLRDRVAALEITLVQTVAGAEALAIKAESRFKAARSAEERGKGVLNRAAEIAAELAEGDEEGQVFEPEEPFIVPPGNAQAGGGGEVPLLHPSLDAHAARTAEKLNARERKFATGP